MIDYIMNYSISQEVYSSYTTRGEVKMVEIIIEVAAYGALFALVFWICLNILG